MAIIYKALDECCAEHPVFYEDEVDIHLNSKIGAGWQIRGQQIRVVIPRQNEKYYLAPLSGLFLSASHARLSLSH